MYNRPTSRILPRFSGPLILCNDDESNLTVQIKRLQLNEDIDTHKIFL